MEPTTLSQYGPWAVAFAMVLYAFRDILIKAVTGRTENGRPSGDPMTAVVVDNTRAIERLTVVLEAMEASRKETLAEVKSGVDELKDLAKGMDYRTKEILKIVEAGRR